MLCWPMLLDAAPLLCRLDFCPSGVPNTLLMPYVFACLSYIGYVYVYNTSPRVALLGQVARVACHAGSLPLFKPRLAPQCDPDQLCARSHENNFDYPHHPY